MVKILYTRDNHGLSAEDIADYKKKKAEKKAWVRKQGGSALHAVMYCDVWCKRHRD